MEQVIEPLYRIQYKTKLKRKSKRVCICVLSYYFWNTRLLWLIKYDSDNMELIFTEEKHLRLIQRCHMQFGAVAYIQMAKKMKFS